MTRAYLVGQRRLPVVLVGGVAHLAEPFELRSYNQLGALLWQLPTNMEMQVRRHAAEEGSTLNDQFSPYAGSVWRPWPLILLHSMHRARTVCGMHVRVPRRRRSRVVAVRRIALM